jgi:ceramide glucosyltransferase
VRATSAEQVMPTILIIEDEAALVELLRYNLEAEGVGVTIIRPLKGLEPFTHATLQSTFKLSPAPAEILFCVEREDDPVVSLVRQLIASHPGSVARLLIGRDAISRNPKLNNITKGWLAAQHDWITFVDSNVLLP